MTAHETILAAVRRAMHEVGGSTARDALPHLVVAAVEAAQTEGAFKAVRLLRVQSGDIVVFHFDELISDQEMENFRRQVGEHLHERHPDVQFLAADRVSDITVVRPEGRQERREQLRAELEALEALGAQELMNDVAWPRKEKTDG